MTMSLTEVYEPQTGVAAPPVVIAGSPGTLPAGPAQPSVVLVPLEHGVTAASLQAALGEIPSGIIPALVPAAGTSAAGLGQALQGLEQRRELFVVSDDADLLRSLRSGQPELQAILDLRAAGPLPAAEASWRTHAAGARVALLRATDVTTDSLEQLQRLFVTVWLADEDAAPSTVSAFRLLVRGAGGIVSSAPATYLHLLEEVLGPDGPVLLRRPFTIAHRGLPALAPENTLAGARLAHRYGADLIENDIHLTRDGYVVIHHDDTLERTTDGSGALADHSLAELATVRANRQFPEDYPDERLPSLRQFLEQFRGQDVVHVIEIKTADEAVAEPLAALLQETDTVGQAVVISFHPDQLERIRALLPGIPAGFLSGGQVDETDPLGSVQTVLSMVQPLSSTYNPFFMGVGPGFLKAARHRGLSVWPWTVNDPALFAQAYLWGFGGITTNFAHWTTDWARRLKAPAELTVGAGAAVTFQAEVHAFSGSRQVTAEVVLLDAGGCLTADSTGVRAVTAGTGWVFMRHWQPLDDSSGYWLVSAPVRVTVSSD